MRERMQKTINKNIDYPQRNSTECERYEGEQTLIGITENNLTEVIFTKEKLMEIIFNSYNMNKAYLQVRRNIGRGCHNALLQVKEYVNQGNKYVVSKDLEKFFDTVNQSKWIEILSRTIKNGRLIFLTPYYKVCKLKNTKG